MLVVTLSIPTATASSTDMNSDKGPALNTSDVEKAFSLAQDILTSYYLNINLGTENVAGGSNIDTNLLKPELLNYLEQKIKTKQFVTTAAEAEKENYTLNHTLESSEVTKEGIYLVISTVAKFNYVGSESDSGFGRVSNMFFEKTSTGFTLTDWYMPYDYYDEFVRGQMDNSSQLFSNSKLDDTNISRRQAELHDKIASGFSKAQEIPSPMTNLDAEVSPFEVPAPNATLRSLNKKNIVTWARNNMVASPKSGNGVVPYYDFSQIPDNWDCTNFVSHALLAGGAVVYDTGGTGISSTGWYFRNVSNRSSSFSGVPKLHEFLTTNRTKGPAGTSITYRTFDYFAPNHPYELGDILQFYQSGSYNNWRHSTIITEFYETSLNHVGAKVTGRTNTKVFDDNVKAHDIYPGDAKRIIKLTGYYN